MHPGPNPVTKDEAVRRLRAAGFTQEADDLEAWRDSKGNNWGWDGWIRGAHRQAVARIWPRASSGPSGPKGFALAAP